MNKGIKFMLRYNHFMAVPATDEEIARIIADWTLAKETGAHRRLQGTCLVEGDTQDWWVYTDDIVGVHTFTVQLQNFAPPGTLGGYQPQWQGSGLVRR